MDSESFVLTARVNDNTSDPKCTGQFLASPLERRHASRGISTSGRFPQLRITAEDAERQRSILADDTSVACWNEFLRCVDDV